MVMTYFNTTDTIDLSTPEKALGAYIDATNSHVFEKVARVLAGTVIFWFQDQEYRGAESARVYFEGAWESLPDEKYRIDNVVWIQRCQTSATCLFSYSFTGTRNGHVVSGGGKGTNVFVSEQGQWRLIHEHLTGLKKS